jgi:DnaJ family protein A protein 2
VLFDINFPPPNWADKTQLSLLESVLPPRQPAPQLPPDTVVEEVVLADVDTSRIPRQAAHDEMDEDEQGGPQVQCAQQ